MRSGVDHAWSAALSAATASADDCRAIEGDAERLACYDRLATPEEELTPPTPTESATSAGDEASAQAQQAEAARPGLFRRVLGGVKLPKPKPVNVVTSGKIVRVRELARGNFELELDRRPSLARERARTAHQLSRRRHGGDLERHARHLQPRQRALWAADEGPADSITPLTLGGSAVETSA